MFSQRDAAIPGESLTNDIAAAPPRQEAGRDAQYSAISVLMVVAERRKQKDVLFLGRPGRMIPAAGLGPSGALTERSLSDDDPQDQLCAGYSSIATPAWLCHRLLFLSFLKSFSVRAADHVTVPLCVCSCQHI